MRTLLVLIFGLMSFLQGFGQNYFLTADQSGLYASADFGVNSHDFATGATVGYSYKGRISLAASGTHWGGVNTLAFNSLGPVVSYMVVKQDKIPISISLDVGYMYLNYPQAESSRTHALFVGTGIYGKYKIGEKVSIIPTLSISYKEYRQMVDIGTRKSNTAVISVRNAFQFNRFGVTPGVNLENGLWIFTTSFSFAISKSNKF